MNKSLEYLLQNFTDTMFKKEQSNENRTVVTFESRGKELTAKEQEKILILPGSVLYLDASGDFMNVYIYQYLRTVCNHHFRQKLGNFQITHSHL